MNSTLPKWPIFIPSKGRHESRLTSKMFDDIGIPYFIVIEKQEYEKYSSVIDKKKIIVLPHRDEGLTVTRNWIWDYAQNELKTPYFWTFDDNIKALWRWHKNRKLRVKTPGIIRACEDFTERYENVAISGMNYFMFIKNKYKDAPIRLNTRVYSNMLIKTDIPFRNELFFNDDTDLCLRVLKSGYCTVLFLTFLIEKAVTMTIKGGMTDYYEQTKNRLEFVQELIEAHPDVVKLTKKWGRYHHEVDYRPFKKNKLIKRDDIEIPKGVNNYGMKLVKAE